jgi:IS66 C-terminal element/Transposase IS66 family
MDGLNYMPADGTRAAIKNRGLRHHPDGSSSKNYSVSEGRTGDLSKFKKYFYGAPRSMKMGTIVSLWHYDGAASPRAPTTLSTSVGMPSGRFVPSALGM